MVEMNFVRAEISAVLEFYSKATGKIYVPHPSLDGTLTIIAPFRLSIDEAMQVLSAALQVRGFTMVPEGDGRIIRILPISQARQEAIETRFGPVPKPTVPPSQLVTQVFQLRFLNARQAQSELQPLLSAQNALITSTTVGNFLILVDTEANVQRIGQLIQAMDVDLSQQLDIFIIPLQYADVQQVAQTLGQLLAPFGVVVGAGPTRGTGAAAPGGPPGGPPPPPTPAPQPATGATTSSIQIVPYPHGNALLIWAPKDRSEWIRSFISKLDTPGTEDLQVRIFRLVYADALDVERILEDIFVQRRGVQVQPGQPMPQPQPQPETARRRGVPTEPEAVVAADARTNSVIVAATKDRLESIAQLIRELDIDARPNLQFEIIPLQRAYAPELASILQTLLMDTTPAGTRQQPGRFAGMAQIFGAPAPTGPARAGLVRSGEFRVSADTRANALIVAATRENMDLIKQLVAELDKDYAPPVKARVFELRYADALQVADMLNRIVQTGAQPRGGLGGLVFFGMPFEQRVRTPEWMGLEQNVVVADPRRNAILVTTTDANMPLFETIIRELDVPSDLGRLVRVYPIQFVDAQALSTTIQEILQAQRRPTGFLFFAFAGDTQRLGSLQNLQDVTVTADSRTNSLVVTAPPAAFSAVESLIEQLDQPQPQVFIEVIIADVTLTKDLQFGVEWQIMQEKATLFGETFQATTDQKTAPPVAPTQGIFYSIISETFRSTLQALARDQKVRIWATPHILTMANVEARIQIGQLFPVVTSFFPGTGGAPPQINTQLQPIATTLTVTAHVNNAGSILMDIEQTIDEIGGTVVQAGFTQPIITNRLARTSVTVQDGQTVVIGGIMRERAETVETGVPFLKDLPLLGPLFRRTEKQKEKTELMVFLTPRVVRTPEELKVLLERERKRSRTQVPFLDEGAPKETDARPAPTK
ncbi:MAG: secretin N-terminal domain-containing protein [Armatimonadota bacterium]|nr:secretin N-terminal domain-containing protein [Armatimonadota bacterium]